MAKKIFSILLLSALLFNLVGYRLLISFLEDRADTELKNQLYENCYDEDQLISIKIPVTYLPYYNNSTTFEQVEGQVEIGAVQYKYVKRRILNDSLELLCIPNTAVSNLEIAKNEFFKFTNDLERTGQHKNPGTEHKTATNFSVDFDRSGDIFGMTEFLPEIREICAFYQMSESALHRSWDGQPPEILIQES